MTGIITLCGVLVALAGGIWAIPKLLRAVIEISATITAFNKATPVLLEIARSFEDGNGKSLKSSIDRIGDVAAEALQLSKDNGLVMREILRKSDVSAVKATEAAENSKHQDQVLTKQNEVLAEIHEKVSGDAVNSPRVQT